MGVTDFGGLRVLTKSRAFSQAAGFHLAHQVAGPSRERQNEARVQRPTEDDRKQIEHRQRQPAAKKLKPDDQPKTQAGTSSERPTDTDGNSASHQVASGSSDDAWSSRFEEGKDDHPSPQPAANKPELDDADEDLDDESTEGTTNADADSSSNQLASGSSDDAWYSGFEEDSDSESPPISIHCGYLQSTTDSSHIIRLRMNCWKGELQLFSGPGLNIIYFFDAAA
ncbi:hypothetical protein FS837_010208 [Tulasnella sp. UAMH 9824]|nr:hypothetical protein FS837_010208 [Tulasnella sp. UAMH 9824]